MRHQIDCLNPDVSIVPTDRAFPGNMNYHIDGAYPEENAISASACDDNDDPADPPELEAWGFHEIEIALPGHAGDVFADEAY
jgi:hypothetical protein